MKKLKCKNCNGNLVINSGDSSATCPFCGTNYIFDKNTQIYYITNKNTINSELITVQDNDLLSMLKIADMAFRREMWVQAYSLYESITKKFPQESRGYMGCIMSATHNLDSTYLEGYGVSFSHMYSFAVAYSKTQEERQMLDKIEEYFNKRNEYERKKRNLSRQETNNELADNKSKYLEYKKLLKAKILVVTFVIVGLPIALFLCGFLTPHMGAFVFFIYILVIIIVISRLLKWRDKNAPGY